VRNVEGGREADVGGDDGSETRGGEGATVVDLRP
jgi:hypothetical protein